jgi:hypothetical protein
MSSETARATIAAEMAAVLNLNHPAHVISWHFFSMSVANLIVIAVMLVVFVLAIVIPFPAPHEEESR